VQQERLAAVGQLAAGIAHDFNNILTTMLGYAELLRMSPDIPEAVQADLEKIVASGQRAAYLVRQILDFSHKSIRRPKQLDLGPFIKEIVKFLEQTLPETIQLSLEIEPGDYLIEADPIQIQQMLTNLVLNAKDAMPVGGELRVILSRVEMQGEVSCVACNQAVEGDWICLTVTDTGSGIPPEVLPHIFEPFFTTKEVGQGSGLGLSQVLGIIQQHAGHIVLNSQASQGTTVTTYLSPLRARQNKTSVSETTPEYSGNNNVKKTT
jgi:signal transduction histidine kinase